MYKIGISGHDEYGLELNVMKFCKKLYDTFGPTATIITGGSKRGPEYWAKKYALEFGLQFKEYNPSYSGHNLYSALPPEYYGKGYHFSQNYDRYKRMSYAIDKLVLFCPEDIVLVDEIQYLYKNILKQSKQAIIIN